MILILVLLSSVLAAARADCDACVNGMCHSRKTLIRGFDISDQMAIDQFHNILYVQLNSNMNTALYLDEMQIRLVLTKNTSGLTVDQDSHLLYTADINGTLYTHIPDNNTIESNFQSLPDEAKSMFSKYYLYFTRKCCKGLEYLNRYTGQRFYIPNLVDYSITEFVVDKNYDLFFIADAIVYRLNHSTTQAPKILFEKYYSLSIDKYGELYLGDPLSNIIYKLDYTTNGLTKYAAYNTGTIDKFVFDSSNNIIFHDKVDGNVYKWQSEYTECSIKTNCTFFVETESRDESELENEIQ